MKLLSLVLPNIFRRLFAYCIIFFSKKVFSHQTSTTSVFYFYSAFSFIIHIYQPNSNTKYNIPLIFFLSFFWLVPHYNLTYTRKLSLNRRYSFVGRVKVVVFLFWPLTTASWSAEDGLNVSSVRPPKQPYGK